MDEPTDIAGRTQRFTEAARAFAPPSPSRHAKLAPFRDGIVELRTKGASLRLIRELLSTVGVSVGTDTIARFLSEVNGEPMPGKPPRRPGRRRAPATNPTRLPPHSEPASDTPAFPIPTPPPIPDEPIPSDTFAERSRTRGPRIADPRNL